MTNVDNELKDSIIGVMNAYDTIKPNLDEHTSNELFLNLFDLIGKAVELMEEN